MSKNENYEIQFLERDRRILDNRIYDVIDYKFAVSSLGKKCTVAVGISGLFHDPLKALGKSLTEQELIKVAEDWLKSRLAKGCLCLDRSITSESWKSPR